MSSTRLVDENLSFIDSELRRAQAIDILVLPENFAQMPKHLGELYAEPMNSKENDGQIQNFLTDIARRYNLHIIAGSVPIHDGSIGNPYARCLIVGPSGVVGHYDKLHLFDVDVAASDGSQRYRESDSYQRGQMNAQNTSTHSFKIGSNAVRLGPSICYDLRFPELYRKYAAQGVNIITVPAAFTFDTGQAHWQTLLIARAIENQAFVLAAAQVGEHASGRRTWGHSMVIDPWGKVLACKEHGQGLLYAELDLNQIDKLKDSFPVLAHKRFD